MPDYATLPNDLPVPEDDGAADHLVGALLPHLALLSTTQESVTLDELGPRRSVLYIYPLAGQPGRDLPDASEPIPGARGCTPEAGGFRDHYPSRSDPPRIQQVPSTATCSRSH